MNNNSKTNDLLIIIGLLPFIALTNSAINSLAIGLVVIIVFIISSIIANLFKKYLIKSNSTIILIIISATISSLIDQFMQIHIPSVHSGIELFLPLTAVSSFLFNYINNFKNTDEILSFTFNGVKKWSKISLIFLVVGMVREIFGRGTLFNQPVLSSDPAANPVIILGAPSGAFIITAFVLAIFFKVKRKNE